ncbi:hypothetical protein [Bradyrhizobium brasilense]|uniref:hypothetical protein n=1 Tax=Bradyrhizobium brasilense TaxID=1419277 RepID=UPI001F42ABCE|nr:hypothetical protein [Bradyrhizobium brasilense]
MLDYCTLCCPFGYWPTLLITFAIALLGLRRRAAIRKPCFLLMSIELAIPLLAAIFLEINAFIIAAMVVVFVAHQLTALWDTTFASHKRRITPIEQQVHSFLELSLSWRWLS